MESTIDSRRERLCESFLVREAECLDDRRYDEWLKLLGEGLRYDVPVRTVRENWDGSGVSDRAFFMEDDFSSISLRVKRLASRYAWAENPATRTRRMIGNIRVGQFDKAAGIVDVRSNVAIFCYRGDDHQPIIITAERFDQLAVVGDEVKLVRRTAIMDAAVLGLEALCIFL